MKIKQIWFLDEGDMFLYDNPQNAVNTMDAMHPDSLFVCLTASAFAFENGIEHKLLIRVGVDTFSYDAI